MHVKRYGRWLRPAGIAVVSALYIAFTSSFLHAQTSSYLDGIVEQESLRVGQAVYLVLTASGYLAPEASEAEAMENAGRLGWRIRRRSAEDPITLGQFSQLLMNAFDIPGGVMYQFFPGPRYSLRELRYREFIQDRGAPGDPVSGIRALRILGRFLDWKEAVR